MEQLCHNVATTSMHIVKMFFISTVKLSSGNVLIYTRTGITDLGSEGGKEIGKMPRNGEKRILYKKQEGSELRLYL